MQIRTDFQNLDAIGALFQTTFTTSEGPEEGRVVSALARALVNTTPTADLRVFCALEGDVLAGAIVFTRLRFGADPRVVWLLSPVAVSPDQQHKGVGTTLIRTALDALRAEGAAAAFTYGDPAYYGRTGFAPIAEADAPAPHPLGQPEGWLAQSLTTAPLTPFPAPARCASALDDAGLW
jgi:predicted N-acetyltransferase YhbS